MNIVFCEYILGYAIEQIMQVKANSLKDKDSSANAIANANMVSKLILKAAA